MKIMNKATPGKVNSTRHSNLFSIRESKSVRTRASSTEILPPKTKKTHEREAKQISGKRVKLSLDASDIFDKAQHELDTGHLNKAFHLLIEAADLGSEPAKRWLHVKKINDSLPQFAGSDTLEMPQLTIIRRLRRILREVQKSNPKYKKRTVNKISNDLRAGHCYGFSILYVKQTLQKSKPDTDNEAKSYYHFCQEVIAWRPENGVFEPSSEFSYKKYKDGDKQGLTPKQEKLMNFTHKATCFIQMLRFAQQTFYEIPEWKKEVPNQKTLEDQNLLTSIPLGQQQDVQGILGPDYRVPMKLYKTESQDHAFEFYISALYANLLENNIALLNFDPNIMRLRHALTIFYRNNLYYLRDSNTKSNEENFDPDYCGLYYKNLYDLFDYIKMIYNVSAHYHLKQSSHLTFIELADANNLYIPQDKFHRFNSLSLISDFYEKYGRSLVNIFFPTESNIFKFTSEMFKEINDKGIDLKTLLEHESIVRSPINTIDCSSANLDIETYKTIILARLTGEIITNDTTNLAEAYYRIAKDGPDGFDLIAYICLDKAKRLGHPEAQMDPAL